MVWARVASSVGVPFESFQHLGRQKFANSVEGMKCQIEHGQNSIAGRQQLLKGENDTWPTRIRQPQDFTLTTRFAIP